MLITLENVSKYYGAKQVLADIDTALNPGDRIGLIGPNGAGKTTLLGLMSGELEPDAGAISRRPMLRVGYFHQSAEQELIGTISDELRRPFSELLEIKKQLDAAAGRMSKMDMESSEGRVLSSEYDRLNTAFEAGEGYLIDVKIRTVTEGMGFSGFDPNMDSRLLSGGERTRLGLARLLLTEPDMLILDEATNHLDFGMLDFLEDWLTRFKGALLTVSHDRHYLNKVTNKTWEIEAGRLTAYPAAYNGYLPLKEQRDALMQKEHERYLMEKEKLEDYVRRNITRASTSSMAKSRIKMLERLDDKPPPTPAPKPPRIRFSEKRQPVKEVLAVRGLAISVGEGATRKRLFSNLNLTVMRGERLAVIGPNGVGKSSLFAALSGMIRPDAGEISWGRGTDVSCFAQDDSALSGRGSVLDYLWDRFPSQDAHTLRTTLGGVGITGDAVYKSVSVLSGGEKAKVKVAVMLLLEGNVLLMDEPTNHLDIPAKERLEEAIRDFAGTVITISHDRRFLSVIPTRILELDSEGGRFFDGNFTDYTEAKKSEAAVSTPPPAPVEEKPPSAYYRTKKQRSAQQALRNKIALCESEIEGKETRIAEIEAQLAHTDTASDYQLLLALTEELNDLRHASESLLEEWERLHSELETI